MSMTMTQKILAAHAGLPAVQAGDLIEAKLDLVLGNDVTAPVAIGVFEQAGFTKVFDREKIAIVLDHYTPCKDIQSAQLCKTARDFARAQGIRHFYDVGTVGIEHALLPEQGIVAPGELIIGADSHTCTYGALAPSPPASAPRTWRPAWRRAKTGSRSRPRSRSRSRAHCRSTSAART